MSAINSKWAFLALGVIGGIAGFYFWDQRASAVSLTPLVAGFEKKNELIVFAAQVVPVVTQANEGWIDLLDSEQTAVIPASVNYTIDLSKLTEKDVSWNGETGRMVILVPRVVAQPPNLFEQQARYYRKGVWSPAETEKLTRRNSIAAIRSASELANKPFLLAMAQRSAQSAVASTAEAYLRGAGRRDAEVIVRFKDTP